MTKTATLAVQAGADGLSPVELLLGIVRDENQSLTFRAQCAGIVLPYVTPRLANVQIERKPNNQVLAQILERMERIKQDDRMVIDQEPMKTVQALPIS
jgi:hypothetical protein